MAVHIQITDKLALGSDSQQWTLTKPVTVKNKDTDEKSIQWQSFNYFGTLNGAVKAAGDLLLRQSGAQSAKELVEAAERINALINYEYAALAEIKLDG